MKEIKHQNNTQILGITLNLGAKGNMVETTDEEKRTQIIR